MDIEYLRNYCLDKAGVTEDTPFGPDTLVLKVKGKMFALFNMANFTSINLKCKPELAEELRDTFVAVSPGYHMNKKHWNTISFHSDMPDQEILNWVDHSYALVVSKLPKKVKVELGVL